MTENILLKDKEFVLTVKWIVDADYVFSDNMEDYLEKLREIGEATLVDVQLRDKTRRK